ncbi:hypothetical protein AC1031_005879 [Aphanomyces cochlioides]|nr:hypothetical protein AC1031_005879 [Aphanomyces cochlioides]
MTKRCCRIRLLEPTCASSRGGALVTVQGVGFRGPPHAMTIQLAIPFASKTLALPCDYVTESQLTFVVPDVTSLVKSSFVEARVSLSEADSTPLEMILHPEFSTKKIFPMHMPLSATSNAKITVFLNIRYALSFVLNKPHGGENEIHITSRPVFARISYVSDTTKASVQAVRQATWNATSALNGDLMLEFNPPKACVGIMQVEISLNKIEYYGSMNYTVLRDFALSRVRPRCILISTTQNTQVSVRGDSFVDSGEVILQLLQPPPELGPTAHPVPLTTLSAIVKSPTEITAALPPRIHHGITSFAVSCNHGEHFCPDFVQALLYRERLPQALFPTEGSISGGTTLSIRMNELPDEASDSFQLLYSVLKVDKVIRVKFEPQDTTINAQTVFGEPDMNNPATILCTVPSFEQCRGIDLFPVHVSISLDGKHYVGNLPFAYYGRFVVKSLSIHHGPNTGGTHVRIQMNHPLPLSLPVAVKFTSKANHANIKVKGWISKDSPTWIECATPTWSSIEGQQLTKVQVSLNQGVDYIPPDESVSNAVKFRNALEVDDSYLLFLFYTPPEINYVWPTSSSQAGGGILRLKGRHVIDHGGTVSVVFSNGRDHRKVRGFIELDPTRHSDAFGNSLTLVCCTPSFPIGVCDVYVSLNDQQYSKCSFENILISTRTQFLFFTNPVINSVSPISSPAQASSNLVIRGEGFIDTGSIQVRFTHIRDDRDRQTSQQFVEGKLNAAGHIVCQTPILKVVQPVVYSKLDISLNSYEYSDIGKPFYFFRQYKLTKVEPPGIPIELPTKMRLYVQPTIISDIIKLRLKVSYKKGSDIQKKTLGSVDAISWANDSIDWICPALASLVSHLSELIDIHVEVAMNGQHYLEVGNLLLFCSPYQSPRVHRIWPLAAPFDETTELHLFGEGFDNSHEILVRATIPGYTNSILLSRTMVAAFISPEQIVVECPKANSFTIQNVDCRHTIQVAHTGSFRGISRRRPAVGGWKVMPIQLELSICHDQFSPLPFQSRFYFPATTLSIHPLAGFTSGGTIVTLVLESSHVHYMDMMDSQIPVLFGDVWACGTRQDNMITVVTPELPPGQHLVYIAINQQTFDIVKIEDFPVHFEAYAPPILKCVDSTELANQFGPISGGTPVKIQGSGFVASGKVLVNFLFPEQGQEYIVDGSFSNANEVECIAPCVKYVGRASIQVSCNGQQYSSHEQLSFEYHLPTRLMLDSQSATCGSIQGGTLIRFSIMEGLPRDLSIISPIVKFTDDVDTSGKETFAHFDSNSHSLTFQAPSWPRPTRVHMHLSLNNRIFYIDMGKAFLYFTPPQPIRTILPTAGPITGGTYVEVVCPDAIDTGKACFKLTGDNGTELIVEATFKDHVLSFRTPGISHPCRFIVQLSLNGIDYTSPENEVGYHYYMPPVLHAIVPGWGPNDAETPIVLYGDHIADYHAPVQVQFKSWLGRSSVIVNAQVTYLDPERRLVGVSCAVPQGLEIGYCRVEFSLNGQQFTMSDYADPRHVNPVALQNVKSLFPFRCFAPPFYLATLYGSSSGGSRVLCCGSGRLSKLMARGNYKCHMHFTPSKFLGHQSATAKLPDAVLCVAEVDSKLGTVSCRAPSFRFACLVNIELIFGDVRKADGSLILQAKEKLTLYEPPTAVDINPSCGPLAGGSTLVLQGTHIYDSNQVHVRFQTIANKHEWCVVRGQVSHTFPNGAPSKPPLILCHAPKVERITSTTLALLASASQSTAYFRPTTRGQLRSPKQQLKGEQGAAPSTPMLRREGTILNQRHIQQQNTLLVDSNSFGNLDTPHPFLDVTVDFSLNGGEQFLARSIPYRFYTPVKCENVVFGPIHVPMKNLDQAVGLEPPYRMRQLVISGFDASTLCESKCIGIKFELISDVALVLVSPGHVVCDLPDFPVEGRYRVLFALNSQEFTELVGELHVHAPLQLMECSPNHFPFQGGHHMQADIVPSSVMTSLQDSLPVHGYRRFMISIAPAKHALTVSPPKTPAWRPWRKHVIELVFPGEKPSRDAAILTARHRDTGWILAQLSLDVDVARGEVDATDWIPGKVMLSVHLNELYNTYKTVVWDVEKTSQVVLTKRPAGESILVLGKLDFVNVKGKTLWSSTSGSLMHPTQILSEDWIYIIAREMPSLPILLLSSDQTILHVNVPSEWSKNSSVWLIGAIRIHPFKEYVEIDQLLASDLDSLPTIPDPKCLKDLQDDYKIRQEAVWTLGNEIRCNLSLYVKCGTHITKITPSTFVQKGDNYHVQWTMPAFSNPDTVLLWAAINDICFSAAVSLFVYDPTKWKLQSLQPSCGLHGKSIPLKLKGVGFVETHSIRIRFASPTHAMDVPGHIRLRQFFNITAIGMTVAGRTYSENNIVFSLHIQFNEESPLSTGCRRVLYHLKKDMGTLLWNEAMQFEVLEPQRHITLTLKSTSDMGEIEDGVKLRNRNFKTIATKQISLPDLETGQICRQVLKLDNTDHTSTLRREVELNVCLDPPLLDTEMIVAKSPVLPDPCSMNVQVSSGQFMWTSGSSIQFHVYELPQITRLEPPFLPHTSGGIVTIRGHGFFNSGLIMLKVVFVSACFDYQHGESDADIQAKLDMLVVQDEKMLEIPVTFVSTTELRCEVPPNLQSRNIVLCVSFDKHTFTPLTTAALFHMFTVQNVCPNSGPVQGRTYTKLRGTNLCLSQSVDEMPLIRFSWYRAEKLLERTTVHGEFHSGVLYCYTPACRLGLDKLHVLIDLCLGGSNALYSNDNITFIYYKIPIIRNISPKTHLVPGATDLTVYIVESWENAHLLSTQSRKCRFRMKGQAQVADASEGLGGQNKCRLPRFTVPVATPQLLPGSVKDDPLVPKLWVRNSGLFITVLQARNLRLQNSTGNSASICPVVLLSLDQQRQRTALKEYTSNPIFNEQFDFDLNSDEPQNLGDLVITVEHESKSMRNDIIGVLKFPLKKVGHTVLLRAWFTLSPPQSTGTVVQPLRTARQLMLDIVQKDSGDMHPPESRGEVELFVHYEPMVIKREPSDHEVALRGKFRSVIKKTIHIDTIAKRLTRSDTSSNIDRKIETPPPMSPLSRTNKSLVHVIPNEIIVEIALNGQDYLSQCPLTYFAQPLPIIESITPKCIPSRGGTKLTIHGHNFVDTKCIRVAFLWGVEHYAALKQSFRVETDVFAQVPVTVVDGLFESPTQLHCTTPPTRFPPKPCFTLLVALNGMDFNSIFLPPFHDTTPTEDIWSTFEVKDPVAMLELPQNEYKIYETPVVHSIQSASAVYTTKLIFRGENFGSADCPKARFVHMPTKPNESKCEDAIVNLSIMSSVQLECWAPDLPPGSMVQIQIAMNGHDFMDMPGLFCICNAPKMTKLEPSWIFSGGNPLLKIHGSNFIETDHIMVSFMPDKGATPIVVRGKCSDGVIHCNIPTFNQFDDDTISNFSVDVSLGKDKNSGDFTGSPLLLQLYHNVPQVSHISPTDGPLWGGTKVILRGHHFANSPSLVVRFTRLNHSICPKTQTMKWHVVQDEDHCIIVKATFESPEIVTCSSPSVPEEGPAAVQLSLNGHDFSNVHNKTWFVTWRTWQNRVSILRQSMQHDGGARLAWQKYFELRHTSKMNFYSGRIQTTSWKLHATHHASPAPPKRVDNLPEIMREIPSSTKSKDGQPHTKCELESELYIPPDILWPDENCLIQTSLTERLKQLYRSSTSQQLIYSRLILVYDNAKQLNAKYTSASSTDGGLDSTSRAFPPIRNASFDGKTRQRGLCFHGLCEGLRWIFPQATEADLVELWAFMDPQKTGTVSLDAFCSRLQPHERPPSPEPGPMHYDPQMPLPHIPTPTILESSTEPTPPLPQPFLDVGPVIDVLQPQSPRVYFSRREEMKAQWCDPLYRGPGSEIAKPDLHLDDAANTLSTYPRVQTTTFPPLSKEDLKLHEAKNRSKLPPETYGIHTLKPATVPATRLDFRRSSVFKLPKPVQVKGDGAMFRRRTSIVFHRPTESTRKLSQAVARKSTAPVLSMPKQFKDAKPIYLDILTSQPRYEFNKQEF